MSKQTVRWRRNRQGEQSAVRGDMEAAIRMTLIGWQWIVYGADGISIGSGYTKTSAEAMAEAQQFMWERLP